MFTILPRVGEKKLVSLLTGMKTVSTNLPYKCGFAARNHRFSILEVLLQGVNQQFTVDYAFFERQKMTQRKIFLDQRY